MTGIREQPRPEFLWPGNEGQLRGIKNWLCMY